MNSSFADRTAIVTGAGSGIGRATTLALVVEGCRVVAIDRDHAALATLAAEGHDAILTLAADITDPDTPAAALEIAGGQVGILANVAGVMDSFLAAGEVDDETWDRVMAVNATAPMRLMRAVLPSMLSAGRGAIVNVCSEAGLKGGCAGAAYTASKHALVGLTRNTAFLYATKGVRVNAIAPGPVETGMRPDFRSPIAAERLPALLKASISRLAQPEEVARTITWLASDEAHAINGAILPVDGGWSAA